MLNCVLVAIRKCPEIYIHAVPEHASRRRDLNYWLEKTGSLTVRLVVTAIMNHSGDKALGMPMRECLDWVD